MSIKEIIAAILSLLLLSEISFSNDIQGNFQVVEEKLGELKGDDKYDEAIELLNSIRADFPENDFEISDWYATIYLDAKQYDKAYDIWTEGHKKGYFYLLHPQLPPYKEIAETDEFRRLSEKDLELRTAAIEKSKSVKAIILPEHYDKTKEYPLLIALHGGGSTIKRSKSHWHSEKLNKEFIVMFIQSYRHYNLKKFGWSGGDDRARNDIRNLFDEVVSNYSIDTSSVIIGGVSAGGLMAIDIAVNDVIPIAGFYGICPAEPKELNTETASKMKKANLNNYGSRR